MDDGVALSSPLETVKLEALDSLPVIIIIKSNTYDITIIAKNPSNNKLILFKLLESKTTL